jgi:hypothetical protein
MLTVAAVLLLALVTVSAVPVTLAFKVSWREALQQDIRLRWAFGLVRVRFASSQTTPTAHGPELERRSRQRKRPSRNKPNFLAAVRQKAFRRRIGRFVGDLWRVVKKDDLSLRVRIGFGDPADTGQLWALFGPIAGMLASVREASISIEPEFFEPVLHVDGCGTLRIVPLQVFYLTLALLLSPPFWQGVGQMRRWSDQ